MTLPIGQPPPEPSAVARLGDRGLFPDLGARAYLNHAAISPPSTAVKAAVQRALDDYGRRGTSAFVTWHSQRLRLKERLARLLGGQPDQFGLVPNTTAGINVVAQCTDWLPGDRILVFRGEFPTNVTPWQQAAKAFELKLEFLDIADFAHPSGPDFGPLEAALPGARMLAISAVQFQTGLRVPLTEIARRCRAEGVDVCVDGIQAVGGTPLDLDDCDYLCVGGHKWLMGVEGAGFLWARDATKMVPRQAGWLSHEAPADFLFEGAGKLRYDKPIRSGVAFVEGGAPNSIGYAALEASLALIEQVGVEAVHAHANAYHDLLEPALVERGFTSARLPGERRSAILGVTVPEGVDLAQLAGALDAAGVAVSTPDGYLRFAPHWPNALDEVPLIIAAIDAAL